MLLRRLVCLVLLFCPMLVLAQDDSGQVITTQNAAQLTELSHIGGAEPGRLAWSPDGTMLAVGTSIDTRLYRLPDLVDPLTIDASGSDRLYFNSNEVLLTDHPQPFDLVTGEFNNAAIPAVVSNPRIDDRFEITQTTDENTGTVIIHDLTGINPDLELQLELEQRLGKVAFNAAGTQVAVGLQGDIYNGIYPTTEIQLWELATGTIIKKLPYFGVIFSFIGFSTDDRQLLVETTGYVDDTSVQEITLWETTTGEMLEKWRESFSFLSPDGQWLVFVTERVYLWDGQQVINLTSTDYYSYEEGYSTKITFTPDSKKLTVIAGGALSIWDLKPGLKAEDAWIIPLKTESRITPIFSPDLSLVAIGNEIWDTSTRKLIKTLGTALTPSRFSPDNRVLLMRGNNPETTGLWDIMTGGQIFTHTGMVAINHALTHAAYWQAGQVIIREIEPISEIALDILRNNNGTLYGINPQGTLVVFQQHDAYQVFDLITGEALNLISSAEERQVLALIATTPVFAVRGVGDRGTVSFYQKANPDVPLSAIQLPDGYEYRTGVSPDGQYYTVEQLDGRTIRYDTATGAVVWSLPDRGTLSPNTDLLVSTSFPESWVEVYDTKILKVPGQIVASSPLIEPMLYFELPMRVAYPGNLHFTFSPTGQYLIIEGIEAVVQDGEYLGETSRGFIVEIDQIIEGNLPDPFPEIKGWEHLFSPDEQLVISRQYGGGGHFIATTAGRELAVIPGTIAAAFNPDGTLMALASGEQVIVYGVDQVIKGDLTPLVAFPVVDILPVELMFSPDGKRLIWQDEAGISVWGLPD